MNPQSFLRLRLVCARFEGHSVPLAFLKDIAVLEEMIVEVPNPFSRIILAAAHAAWLHEEDSSDDDHLRIR